MQQNFATAAGPATSGRPFLLWCARLHAKRQMIISPEKTGVLRLVADQTVSSRMGIAMERQGPVLGLQANAFDAMRSVGWSGVSVVVGEEDGNLVLRTPAVIAPADHSWAPVPVEMWLPINPVAAAGIIAEALKAAGRLAVVRIAEDGGRQSPPLADAAFAIPAEFAIRPSAD